MPPDNSSSESDTSAFEDAADRLAQQIELQVQIIDGIDDKAAHVTRLIALLLGLIFTVLSLSEQLDQLSFENTAMAVDIAFLLGILSLLLGMATAIITYLSSRMKIGLHHSTGYYLSQTMEPVPSEKHLKRVCGSYAEALEINEKVIEANSKRFRLTLTLLLLGVLFLSTAGTFHFGGFGGMLAIIGLAASICIGLILSLYIQCGKYITAPPVDDIT